MFKENRIMTRRKLSLFLAAAALICLCSLTFAACSASAETGRTVTFGHYEQDNKFYNGAEPIEWTILESYTQDGVTTSLLISKYALDARPFNRYNENCTWDSCSLRTWLNNEFLNAAFTPSEQAKINFYEAPAEKNPYFDVNPGRITKDKVFLLNYDEENYWFSSDFARRCSPTEYAKAQGAYYDYDYTTPEGKPCCSWWLRCPGDLENTAALISNDGRFASMGDYVNGEFACVRPAMWVRLG